MNNDFVDMRPIGLTRGVSLEDAFILLLREEGGSRCVPILIDRKAFMLLRGLMLGRHIKERSFAEQLAELFDISLDSVVLHQPSEGGEVIATLFLSNQVGELRTLRTDIATGVRAAMTAGRPLRLPRSMFDWLARRSTPTDGRISFPVSAMTLKLLEEALAAAVAEDNFELASILHDEIKSRKRPDGETPSLSEQP